MDEFVSRKPINTRKGKRFHRHVERKTKFATETYWKIRKNRALHQQSRAENEVDHADFLLPAPRMTKWETVNVDLTEKPMEEQDMFRTEEYSDLIHELVKDHVNVNSYYSLMTYFGIE